ncbi:GNAT family N-acetyltransferase [Bacillus salipaludis]|uniref:GNAT family N-acetyltransferase n=1 Tax=Bacillus salipaludis TaxID=2547811 RepID=A0AA90R6W7_9BACI|nr:GNAT family N-acetyltransferase [Bacillus salipaludis]MDQ6599171.1 GNAT family N-acetyltransferase [Bacillus salipaludis]
MEIVSISLKDYKNVKQFYTKITDHLKKKRIFQWDRFYPNRFVIKGDIKKGNLYGIFEEDQLVAAITLDVNGSKRYEQVKWEDLFGNPLIVHRLAVHPCYQGKGVGNLLLLFAEEFGDKNGYTSIRLDVFSGNPSAVRLYEKAGYVERGEIYFPFRKAPYKCFEKTIENHINS